jgi:hypothetical protein
MKKLEMIKLEPYKAPALKDITPLSTVNVIGASTDPEQGGGDLPTPDPGDPSWGGDED